MSDASTRVGTADGQTGSIRRSSSRASSRKKKASQIPIGIAVFIALVVLGVLISVQSATLGFFWFTGIIFGFILQKARFCFTASLRDPYLTGGTSLTKAVLTALAVTTIGFAAIMYGAHLRGLPVPGMSFVVPVSLATAIGAVMFGIGMVISGGCASGTLMRVGEGFLMQIISLFFFVVGSLIGAAHMGWWRANVILAGRPVFLPDVFGWFGAVVVQLLIIALLWIAADKYGKAKQGADAH